MIEAESQMAEAASYEEQRRRQVEANKRKLEELRLHHLSAAVRESAAKPSPVRFPSPFLFFLDFPWFFSVFDSLWVFCLWVSS
jgi:hypothetical protein